MAIKDIHNRLFIDTYVVEFDGTQYAMPLNILTSDQWGDVITLALPDLVDHELVTLLETIESLEGGYLEPDMITEEIALGADYLMITPISDEITYIEHENSEGIIVGYQIANIFTLETLLEWLGVYSNSMLTKVLSYLESVNGFYVDEFSLDPKLM